MAWKCLACGKRVENVKIVKCPYCGYRVLSKERPLVVKKVKTD